MTDVTTDAARRRYDELYQRSLGDPDVFWLEAAACVVGVVLSQSMRAPIAEALPAGAFHLWILAVAVHAWRSDARVGWGHPDHRADCE